MTIVNIDTGEVIEPLTFDEAVELTDSIRESVADLQDKVVRAYRGSIWIALEYESWDSYLTGEFGKAPLALPREERPAQVASLREQGLSMPAIASATGASLGTVHGDLQQPFNSEKLPERVTGLDGKERPATRTQEVKDMTPEQRESCPYCGQDLPDRLQIPPDRRR